MNSLTVALLIALAAVALGRPEEKYTDKYDQVDLTEILSNKRLLKPYLDCALEKGRCSADGKELKSHIREALENNCAKCTETQRNGARRVLGHILNNEPAYWEELADKYDPERKYMSQYEKDLREAKA